MSGNLGSLVLELQGNVAKTQEDMGRLNAIVEASCRRMDAAAERTSRNIQGIGRGGLGRIEGAEEAARSIEKVGHASVGARREMLVLAHEISQGNFKRAMGSLMVLGERMDIMGKVMSPMGIGIGVVVAAIGALAVAAYKGADAQQAFNRSLVLTGGFAGVTEGKFNDMARGIAQSGNVTIGTAREMAQALIETGRFNSTSIESVARAASDYAKLTGQKAEEVVKNFEKMGEGALKWALEMNKQTHFMTGALFDQIKALEESGHKQEAMKVASDALSESFKREAGSVGALSGSLQSLKNWFSSTLTSMEDFLGRLPTIEERIKGVQDAIARAPRPGGLLAQGTMQGAQRDTLEKQLGLLTGEARNKDLNSALVAYQRQQDDRVVAAKEFRDNFEKAHHIGDDAEKKALKEVTDNLTLAGAPAAEIAKAQAAIRKEFEHGAGGGNINHAMAESAIKPLQDQIAAEDKLLSYRERMLEKYYKDDRVSIQAFYDDKRTFIEANIKRVAALYDQEIAVQENAARHAKNRAEAINDTTKADALRDQKAQAMLAAQEKLDELTQDQARDTEKYRDEVTKLTAELDKLNHVYSNSAGVDFDRQHSALRKQASAAGDTDTLDTLSKARDATVAQARMNDLKTQAKDITEALTLAEKRLALQVAEGQKSEFEGDYLLSQARIKAAAELEGIADQMQNVAAQTGLPALINEAQQFKLEQDQVGAAANVMAKNVSQFMGNGLTQILENTMNKTKSLKQSVLDFANSVEQTLTRLIAQDLFNQLFNIGGQNGGSSDGGWLGQLIGAAMGLFGGGDTGGGPATFTGDAAWGLGLPGRAFGGPTVAGGMYEVNERGPELLTVANRTFLMMGDQSGKVTPMSGSNTGGSQNVFHMNIAVPPGTTRATSQQQARAIMTQAQIAMARNA